MSSGHKHSLESVAAIFRDGGCELLETSIVSTRNIKLRYRCSCGKESAIRLGSFQSGSRCRECGLEKANAKKRRTLEEVRSLFESRGCCLLEKEYRNSQVPLRYRCSCGHESSIRLFCLIKGQLCQKCMISRREHHPSWNHDRDAVRNNKLFARKCRNMVKHVLRKMGASKDSSTEQLLGYTFRDLQNHISKDPKWETLHNTQWHLDHIYPIKAFLDFGILDIRLINSLENLRPLAATENKSKSDKYDALSFANWLRTKGIIVDHRSGKQTTSSRY